jgi:hypothetical protein
MQGRKHATPSLHSSPPCPGLPSSNFTRAEFEGEEKPDRAKPGFWACPALTSHVTDSTGGRDFDGGKKLGRAKPAFKVALPCHGNWYYIVDTVRGGMSICTIEEKLGHPKSVYREPWLPTTDH